MRFQGIGEDMLKIRGVFIEISKKMSTDFKFRRMFNKISTNWQGFVEFRWNFVEIS